MKTFLKSFFYLLFPKLQCNLLNLKLLIQKFDLLVKNSEKIRLMLNSKMKDYIPKSSKIIKTSIEAANTVKQRVCKSCMEWLQAPELS